ncbi:hypothetical protein ACQEUU_34560 [Nonomuraea sp. CA-218870]|uniref:hypothetical protein n=1 Tax=Nonomuraea sp. CA-218870 TaxID=3239998 RepID=UPI003D8CC9A5
MHPDIHLRLMEIRDAELRERADRWRATRHRRPMMSWRAGWTLVELGLRLVHRTPAHFQRI